jgi:hypothetical protein
VLFFCEYYIYNLMNLCHWYSVSAIICMLLFVERFLASGLGTKSLADKLTKELVELIKVGL